MPNLPAEMNVRNGSKADLCRPKDETSVPRPAANARSRHGGDQSAFLTSARFDFAVVSVLTIGSLIDGSNLRDFRGESPRGDERSARQLLVLLPPPVGEGGRR